MLELTVQADPDFQRRADAHIKRQTQRQRERDAESDDEDIVDVSQDD